MILPSTRLTDEEQEIECYRFFSQIRFHSSPVYQPVNHTPIWLTPVNIRILKICADCLTSRTVQIIETHQKKMVQGTEIQQPACKLHLVMSLKETYRILRTPPRWKHAGYIRQLKQCVTVMRTMLSTKPVIQGTVFRELETISPRCGVESRIAHRRRCSGFPPALTSSIYSHVPARFENHHFFFLKTQHRVTVRGSIFSYAVYNKPSSCRRVANGSPTARFKLPARQTSMSYRDVPVF